MNFATLFKAFDAVVALRDAAQRFKGQAPPSQPDTALTQPSVVQGLAGQLETRLTGVVVAALKEAFDRDHARLELERAQIDEQRRRAEEALRLELRRQNVERELGRLRLLAGAAMVGWLASLLLLAARLQVASTPARVTLAAGWLCLLGALGAAFQGMGRIGRDAADLPSHAGVGQTAALPMWLLIAGLAFTAISLLL